MHRKNINFPITCRSFIHSTKTYWALTMSQAMCCATWIRDKLILCLGNISGTSIFISWSGNKAMWHPGGHYPEGIQYLEGPPKLSVPWPLPFFITFVSTLLPPFLPMALPGTLSSPSPSPALRCYISEHCSLVHLALSFPFSCWVYSSA